MRYLYRPLPAGENEPNPLMSDLPESVREQVCEANVVCAPHQGPCIFIGSTLIQYNSWEQFYECWMPEPSVGEGIEPTAGTPPVTSEPDEPWHFRTYVAIMWEFAQSCKDGDSARSDRLAITRNTLEELFPELRVFAGKMWGEKKS